jgi:hypothetical protein
MIREKANNNHKNKDQSWYKNQINQILRDEIEKKSKQNIQQSKVWGPNLISLINNVIFLIFS